MTENSDKQKRRYGRKQKVAQLAGYSSWANLETAILTAIESGKEFVVKANGKKKSL